MVENLQHDNFVTIANFYTSKNLDVKNTIFLHFDIRKYTWTSSSGKTVNKIDHIMIDRRWQTIVLDVRRFKEIDSVLWPVRATIELSFGAPRPPLADFVGWGFPRGGECGINYLIQLTNVQSAFEIKQQIELHRTLHYK
jgi:hypothetical protein